ncbi:MAG: SPOR domain-containing protein [Trueperaceae bacterium]|nr:SPOR domain-containing protein [Trueperaceae bacterium]
MGSLGRVSRTVMVAMIALGWAAGLAQGALVPYTVQVAALSDAEAAIELSGRLLRDGFPAYVVRAEGAAGSVFRVRVAAFGDRASADRYARAMSESVGGEPRPALAEAIPAGILPLAPTRWVRIAENERAVVVAWGETEVAVRVGPADGMARYHLTPRDGASFEAWWARPLANGRREEVVALPLDGDDDQGDDPSVQDALFRQRIRLVADRSGLDPTVLEQEAVRGERGSRRLVVWRTTGADTGAEPAVSGVARAGAQPTSRAEADWLGGVPPAANEVLLKVSPGAAGGAAEPTEGDVVQGRAWTARAVGDWTVLEVEGTSWRALVGAPRGGYENLLVLRVDGGFELVRLAQR